MQCKYSIATSQEDFYNITHHVREAVARSGVSSGIALVFCQHTTAAITINENGDPHVVQDMLLSLDAAFPNRPQFLHAEGNSAAHVKASVIGSSVSVIIENGRPLLGPWQAVYFCEFDPPRSRKFFVHVLGDK